MKIRLYDERDGVTVLGPGARYAIWMQGCLKRCPGCISPQSQALDQGYLADPEVVASRILASGRDGMTVSGGEPFLQAEALCELISHVRQAREIGVILFTGFLYPELKASGNRFARQMLRYCDVLIDGEYRQEYHTGTRGLRGSSNQHIIDLTGRYADSWRDITQESPKVEFFMDGESLCMVGIPPGGMLERLKKRRI